ncbi:restriction endonuclease subunit S [Nitrosococcus watsonii]|uniref:Type I restriction enzyme, S subunit n=1 Tax=Nitrosococcus watsoni (strain C-113) TaxID=105559 RepID=D8K8V9_NITWC|nr:restriction endonuclease subunit S [Nitrosococcus watsonii]ADJ27169.1 type I restriction enzyme, S subunit [Nitrosococcus watsonii C-113]
MKLVSYPEYKDSGVPWLEKIPRRWRFFRAKNVFYPIDLRSKTGAEELLSVSERHGVTSRKSVNVTMFQAASYQGYKLCWPGDLVINSLWAWMQGLGFSKYHGIISTAYGVYRPRVRRVSDFRYFDYLLRSAAYKWELRVRSKGIWRSRYQLKDDDFLKMPILLPEAEEQTQIARFLDWKTAQINQFIRNKRRLIELLKEQKQNVINQAVTRGLDPNVRLKPSGVEWIGDIPAHWETTKLKRVVSFNPSKSETRANSADEEKVVFLPMENISVNGDIDCSEKRPLSEVWSGFTYFRRGDVVMAKITPCFENGKGAYLQGLETGFGFGTTELIVLRPLKAIDGAFLRFLMWTKQFLLLGEQYMTGAAGQQRIPLDFVKNYPIGLPPIEEQREILAHIQEKSAEIDQALTRAQREIELIREYRTRLISDVVTGQVDVRGIQVPKVADEELLALDEDAAESDDLINDRVEMKSVG